MSWVGAEFKVHVCPGWGWDIALAADDKGGVAVPPLLKSWVHLAQHSFEKRLFMNVMVCLIIYSILMLVFDHVEFYFPVDGCDTYYMQYSLLSALFGYLAWSFLSHLFINFPSCSFVTAKMVLCTFCDTNRKWSSSLLAHYTHDEGSVVWRPWWECLGRQPEEFWRPWRPQGASIKRFQSL